MDKGSSNSTSSWLVDNFRNAYEIMNIVNFVKISDMLRYWEIFFKDNT